MIETPEKSLTLRFENDFLFRFFRRDREHDSEKKDLRKRESSGDARRRKRDETEEERKIRKGALKPYSRSTDRNRSV